MVLIKKADNNFPSLFDRFMNNDLMDWGMRNFSQENSSLPAVNVQENDDEYLIDVAAPGMKKEDFDINFHNNIVTISSETKNEVEEKEDNYTRKEFSYQSFQRSFSVPENSIEIDKISAKYEDGILKITLPKVEAVKPKEAKKIEIS